MFLVQPLGHLGSLSQWSGSGELGGGSYSWIYKTLRWLWIHGLSPPITGTLDEDPNMSRFNLCIRGSASSFEKIRIKPSQILGLRWKLNNASAYFTTVSRPFETVSVDSAKTDLFVQPTGSWSAGKTAGKTDVVPGVTCLWEISHKHSQDTRVVLFGDSCLQSYAFVGMKKLFGVYKIEMGCWNLRCLLVLPRGRRDMFMWS